MSSRPRPKRHFRLFALLLALAVLTGATLSAAAQGGAETEPNNNFGRANSIAVNSTVNGAINPQRDSDWYSFTVDQHGELRATVSNVDPALDISLRLWDSNRDAISGWYSPLAKGGDTEAVMDLPAPGRYVLEVRDGNDDAASSQNYALNLAFTPSADRNEPNNSFGQAAPLAFDQPTPATILPVRDNDWLAVTVEHHGELQVHVTDVAPELDISLRLWNNNRDTITGWYSPLTKGGDTDAVIDLPAAGRYVIEVRDGNDDGRSVQPFTLTATFMPSPDAFEANNSFGQAANLGLGQPEQVTILPVRDSDWFAFSVEKHGELRVLASNVPAALDVNMRLWNSNRDAITGWYTPLAKGGDTEAVIDLPAAGRYVLEVRDGNDDGRSVEPFTLRADFTPSPDDFEPNNSFGSASSIGVDRSVQATILPKRDSDWYSFDVSHQGELKMQASNVPDGMDIAFRLWNSNRDAISGWFTPLAKGGNTDGAFDLAAAGRYVLEVRDGSDDARSIQPYTLNTKFTPTLDQGEPNNSVDTATPVNLDETIPGNILPAGDTDWCRIEVTAAGDLHILATNVAPDLAIAFRLWDDAGNALTGWQKPLAPGGDTSAVIPIAEPGVYYVEVRDNANGRSIQPYLLRFSMSPIDPATVTLPEAEAPAAPAAETTDAASAPGTILTSGQIGPLGGSIFVQEPDNPAVDGARLTVPPRALPELQTIHMAVGDEPPAGFPLGLEPASGFWSMTPAGLQFTEPVSITLPAPTAAIGPAVFVGHWKDGALEDLGGVWEDGLITARTDSFSTFGVFCGSSANYHRVQVINGSSSPYIEMTFISGPSPDPANPDTPVAGCPPPLSGTRRQQIEQDGSGSLLLRPGVYHFAVSYPQPQPGVANSLFITIPPGGGASTLQITDDGASSDAAGVTVDFPGRAQTAGTNQRPIIACSAQVPAGVTLTSADPAGALPSRIVLINNLKLEQLPPGGDGIAFQATANDPEGSSLSPYWTITGGSQSGTRSGAGVASGAEMGDQYTFRASIAGVYTVFLTVYDNLGLFDECRWVIDVRANARAKIDVISGRTSIEFGRLDEVRQAGVGPIVPALTALRPGVAAPVTAPAQAPGGAAVAWGGLSLCPTGAPGPYGPLPDPESVIVAPSPVDAQLPTDPNVSTDITVRWANPGFTCVYAVVADEDGDPLSIEFEFPGPIFGSGAFFAAVEVPAGFHPGAPAGIPLGGFIRTYPQLDAYNAWVSALYNIAGVVPAIVWEAWDDPCPPGSGNVQNPCPSSLSRGGVENIVARVTDGFSQPPAIDFAPIGVGPEAFGGGKCASVFFIASLTPVPSNPGPGQSVRVTARLSPVTQDCIVEMSVNGTDGYRDRQFIPTNKNGEATLFIPGGEDNVRDLVQARVCVPVNPNATPPPPDQQCTTVADGLPGRLIQMEVGYVF